MFASELASGFGNSRNRVSGSASDQNTYECVSITCSQHPNVRDKYWGIGVTGKSMFSLPLWEQS
jgi:hypothetical protein